MMTGKLPKALPDHPFMAAAPGFSLFTQRKRFSENKMAVSLFSQKMVIFYNYISPLHYQFNGTSYLHSFIGSTSGQSQPGSVRAGEGRHCMLQEHPAGYSAGGSVLAAGSVLVRGFVDISRTESRKQKLYCGMAQRQRKRYLSASHFASARKRRKCKVPLSAECRVPLRMAQGKRRTCGRAAGEYLGTTV